MNLCRHVLLVGYALLLAPVLLSRPVWALTANEQWGQIANQVLDFYRLKGPDLPLQPASLEALPLKAKFLIDPNSPSAQVYQTKNGRPLTYYIFEDEGSENKVTVLWLGGVHADEFAPLYATWRMWDSLLSGQTSPPKGLRLIFVPLLNIDGFFTGLAHSSRRYPWRENGHGTDLNRAFYHREHFGRLNNNPEIEFALDLIIQYKPTYWIAPHAALNILDCDGSYEQRDKEWIAYVEEQTTVRGGPKIPLQDFPTYGPVNSFKNWSLGRLASMPPHGLPTKALTFEFPGPPPSNGRPMPAPGSPGYQRAIEERKQLGRFFDNTQLALQYYDWYEPALWASALGPVDFLFALF